MLMKSRHTPMSRQRGVSMIEVLVALVILLLGLLGLAGTMIQSQRSELESYQRAQALILLQDMASRINANRKVASCYAFTDGTSGTPAAGGAGALTDPTCTTGTADQNARAIQDLREWHSLLNGEAEKNGANDDVGAMIGARGCISFDATTSTYLVTVAWQGLSKTAVPPDGWTCGKDLYGDEKQRRVVGITLKIGELG
jgi:type IV pilus assembly protein PilV